MHHCPHSLIWDHLYPVAILGQDVWRWTGCSGWPRSPYVPQLALCTPQGIAVTGFPSIEPWRFPLQSPLNPVFTCIGRQALTHWGFQTHWLLSHGLAGQSKPLPGVWPLLHANSYEEPYVRARCQVGTKDGWTTTRVQHVPHQRCYPTLTPQTPWNNSIHVMNTTLFHVIILKYFVKWRSSQTCEENVSLTAYQIHKGCPSDWNVSWMFS